MSSGGAATPLRNTRIFTRVTQSFALHLSVRGDQPGPIVARLWPDCGVMPIIGACGV
jgi:hypothetical protein